MIVNHWWLRSSGVHVFTAGESGDNCRDAAAATPRLNSGHDKTQSSNLTFLFNLSTDPEDLLN